MRKYIILYNKVQRLKNNSMITSRTHSVSSSLPCGLNHQFHNKTAFPWSQFGYSRTSIPSRHNNIQRNEKDCLFSRIPPCRYRSLVGQDWNTFHTQPVTGKDNGIALSSNFIPIRLFSLFIYQMSRVLSYPPKIRPEIDLSYIVQQEDVSSYLNGYEICLNYGMNSVDFLLKILRAGVDKLTHEPNPASCLFL